MVVSVFHISCSSDADFVLRLLIPFDIVNGRGNGCLEKQRRRLKAVGLDVGATDNVLLDTDVDDTDIDMANSREKVSGNKVFSLLNLTNFLAAIEQLKARRNPL